MADYVYGSSPAKPTATQGDLVKALTQEHPELAKLRPRLDRYIDCYEGDEVHKYLFQHLRENKESFDKRKDRAYYYNYCASIVDTYVSYLYRKPIVRTIRKKEEKLKLVPPAPPVPQVLPEQALPPEAEGEELPPEEMAPQEPPIPGAQPVPPVAPAGPVASPTPEMEDEDFKRFHEDCDGKGESFNEWMKTTAMLAQVFGFLGVLSDVPQAPKNEKGESVPPATEADRLAKKMFPYVTRIFPTSFVNWEVDDKGELLWLRYREDPPSQTDPFKPRDTSKAPKRYRTWTRDEWKVHDVIGTEVHEVDSGKHNLGRVPITLIYNKKSSKNPLLGVSAISSISSINVGILNWCSLIDEHLYQMCLSILTVQKRLDSEDEITIGNNNVLEFDGTVQPSFIAPSSEPEDFILRQIEKAITEIYRIARLGGATGLQTKEAQSGIAYAFEFNETNNLLAEKADNLERGEKDIHVVVGKWLGKKDEVLNNLLIDYPESFGLDDVAGELTTLKTVQDQCTSDTFKKEVQKRLVKRILPKLDKTLLQQILLEIDTNPAMPEKAGGFDFFGGGGANPQGPIGAGAEPPADAATGEELPAQ